MPGGRVRQVVCTKPSRGAAHASPRVLSQRLISSAVTTLRVQSISATRSEADPPNLLASALGSLAQKVNRAVGTA